MTSPASVGEMTPETFLGRSRTPDARILGAATAELLFFSAPSEYN